MLMHLFALAIPSGKGTSQHSISFDAISLTHCLGTGTFGAVVAGKYNGKWIAMKLPKRHGNDMYSNTELRPLSALPKEGRERRNAVQLYGTVRVPLTWIAEKGPTKMFRNCINATAYAGAVKSVPAIVLEQTSRHRLHGLMSAVRLGTDVYAEIKKTTGGDKTAMRNAQIKHFREMLRRAKKSNKLSAGPLRMFTSPDSGAAFDVLAGVARGMHMVHRNGVVHRGMYPPGENILFKNDKEGHTAVITDFKHAKRCQEYEGGLARALDTYAFGEGLMWLCYGIGRTPIWDSVAAKLAPAVDCRTNTARLSPDAKSVLAKLMSAHRSLHPHNRASPFPNALNRCAREHQSTLDELMIDTWRPLVETWNASLAEKSKGGQTMYRCAPESRVNERHERMLYMTQRCECAHNHLDAQALPPRPRHLERGRLRYAVGLGRGEARCGGPWRAWARRSEVLLPVQRGPYQRAF